MKYLILFLFFTAGLTAQKKMGWDTTKYQKFKTNLIIGVFQSYRNFNNTFQQFKTPDSLQISNNDYLAESNLITGIEVNYDKFGFSLGIRSTPQDGSTIGKGNTTVLNAAFNAGGNTWYLENSLRYYSGFYDSNTANYDTTVRQTGNYYVQPGLTNTVLRSKFLYFTNHRRFSFRSNYACNYRQLKSAATWILSANMNYYTLQNDSSFFPMAARPYYGDYAGMNGLRSLGLSANAGGAATLVIMKGFFIHLMFIVGPEQQWRKYSYGDRSSYLSYLSFSGDFRGSIGFNLKRFYILSTTSNNFSYYNSSFVGLRNRFLSGTVTFGWRFFTKTPEIYKKLQQTKFYQVI